MSQGALKAIVDASALYPLLKRLGDGAAPLLMELAILDLTKYELGSALWKEHRQGLLENWGKVVEEWSKIVEEMPTYTIEAPSLKDVEKIAVERDVTFYDASYIFVAEARGLKLVTEDRELLGKCENAITLEKFLKGVGQF